MDLIWSSVLVAFIAASWLSLGVVASLREED